MVANNEIDVSVGKIDGAVQARVKREQEKRKREEAGIFFEPEDNEEDDEDEDDEDENDGQPGDPMEIIDGNVIEGGMVLRKRRRLNDSEQPKEEHPVSTQKTAPVTPTPAARIRKPSASLSAAAKNRPRTSNGTFAPKGAASALGGASMLKNAVTQAAANVDTKPKPKMQNKAKSAEPVKETEPAEDRSTFTIDNSAPGDEWAQDMQKLLMARKTAIEKKKEEAARKAQEAEEQKRQAEEEDEQLAKFAGMV